MITTEVVLGRNKGAVLPSAIAVPQGSGEFLFGHAALRSDPNAYDLLLNWKLLLGMTDPKIRKEAFADPLLERVFKKYTLEKLLQAYLSHVAREYFGNLDRKPQLIVGIPTTDILGSKAARDRYRALVSQALRNEGFPEPRFFPEPFAIFQYHWNNGHIPDVGKSLSIFVVDIGGGTTNICMMRTHPHGRLARGGVNHEPHGVVTREFGGSQIDKFLCGIIGKNKNNVSGFELDRLRQIKESACEELDRLKLWHNYEKVNKSFEFKFDSGKSHIVRASQIYETIEGQFWPLITDAIGESLRLISGTNLPEKIDKVDQVLLAGGTGQCGLIKYLFEQAFRKNKLFLDCSVLSSPRFGDAVAHGLVVEALANTNQYGIQAARTAPYLQQDIVVLVGHSSESLYVPNRIRAEGGAETPDTKTGCILKAPRDITTLYNKPMSWQFRLKQRPEYVKLEFYRSEGENANPIRSEDRLSSQIKRVCRRSNNSNRPKSDCNLVLSFQPDGFAKVTLETKTAESSDVTAHEFEPVDFHDLCDLRGSMFYSLDLGTTSTLVAKGNADQAATPFALPEGGYTADPSIIERLTALEKEMETILAKVPLRTKFLEEVNKELVAEYVYHSNRIEGSELSRRNTEVILKGITDSTHLTGTRLESRIAEKVTFIDDQGNILTGKRPIKDEVAATNLRDALELTWNEAQSRDRPLSPFFLTQLHSLVMRGDPGEVGNFRHENVRISQTSFVPPDHMQVRTQVQKMFDGFDLQEFATKPVIFQSAVAHASFVSIHPFHDGNGRIARLLSNYFLWRRNFPGILLQFDNRERYYDALEELNSTEIVSKPSASRNITDLLQLFGDLFEDTMIFIQEKIAQHNSKSQVGAKQAEVPDSFAIETPGDNTRLGKLLDAISKRKISLSIENQYANWKSNFQKLLSSARNDFERSSRTLDSASIGTVELREYPIIEFETYSNIRNNKHYNRTWYFELSFSFPSGNIRLIFYFGKNSLTVRNLIPELTFTCSLHIARHSLGGSSRVSDETWCPILEFVHDGSKLGILTKKGDYKIVWEDEPGFSDWTAELLESVLRDLAGITI